MEKSELTEIVTDIFRALSVQKSSIFKKNEEVERSRVVSNTFTGMTYTDRLPRLTAEGKGLNSSERFNRTAKNSVWIGLL